MKIISYVKRNKGNVRKTSRPDDDERRWWQKIPMPAIFRKKPALAWAAAVLAVLIFVFISMPLSMMPEPGGEVLAAPEQTATPAPSPVPTVTDAPAATSTPTPVPEVVWEMLPHLKTLYEQNNDLVGWLKIEGTVVDYPVMHTPPEANDFYLYRTFEKEDDPTKRGTLFIDKFNTITPRDTNLIIHGHNMKDGSMFSTLTKYKDEKFYKEHPTFEYSTLYKTDEYEIVSVFLSRIYNVTDDVFKFYKFYDAETQEEFDDFIKNIKALQLYDTGVTAEFGDILVTLSTCEYTREDGRLVVVGRARNGAEG